MILKFLACVFSILTACSVTMPAIAHSWYPVDCCSGKDCVLADGMFKDSRGDTVVSVGSQLFTVPSDLKRRLSPDGRIHVCIQYDEFGVRYPNCLFVPGRLVLLSLQAVLRR